MRGERVWLDARADAKRERKRGDLVPLWTTITAVRDEQGVVTHYVATMSDISERKLQEEEIRSIACPLLAVQGLDDEYGTLEQIRGIARRVPQTRLLELRDCGHSPHRDQPESVLQAVAELLRNTLDLK